MTTLLDLPGELVCKIFEQLPSLRDMIALRSSRLPFLHLYLRYEQQLRKHQQEKLVAIMSKYLEQWIRIERSHIRDQLSRQDFQWTYTKWKLSRQESQSGVEIQMPESTWGIARHKSNFTNLVLNRMPFITRIDLLDDVYSSCNSRAVDWRVREMTPRWNWYIRAATFKEERTAKRLGLAADDIISLTSDAEVVLDPAEARVYWVEGHSWVSSSAEDFFGSSVRNRRAFTIVPGPDHDRREAEPNLRWWKPTWWTDPVM